MEANDEQRQPAPSGEQPAQNEQPPARQEPTTTDPHALVRDVGLTVGLAAGAVSLLPALIAASAAASHQADALALQRALVTLRDNLGGPWIDPAVSALVPMFIVTYVAAFLGLVATLGFCWYAGYVAGETTGSLDAATLVGRRVARWAWLFWFAATLLAVVLLHLDGSLSWVAATAAKLLFTPSSRPIQGMSVAEPDAAFVLMQLAALLLQAAFGLLLGLYLGGIAGQAGAERRTPFILAEWFKRRRERANRAHA